MANGSMSRVGLLLAGVLVLALVAQSAFVYPRLRAQKAEAAALRESLESLKQRETQAQPRAQAAESEELTRLRKENQELHRLRNEVRQLREAAAQATKPAPAPAATAPAAAQVAQLQRQVQQLQAENQELRAAQQQALQGQVQAQAQVGACINNLRQLDGAKQQWALEHRQPAEAIPDPADLEPYLRDAAVWNCPAGGVYSLNAVGTTPTCGVPGHALP